MGLHVYQQPVYTQKLPHKPQMFTAHQVKQNQSEVETLSSLSPNDLARAINIAPPQRKNDSAPHADLNQHWIWASIWASWGAKEYERHHRASPFLNMVMPCSLLKRCHRSCFLKSYWSLGLTWSYTICFFKALQDIHRYSRLEAERHDFRTNKQPQGSAAHNKFVLWIVDLSKAFNKTKSDAFFDRARWRQ